MHILITGEVGIGKSTLIKKLVSHVKKPVFGFRTEKKEEGTLGDAHIYIHPAMGKKEYSNNNLIGSRTSEGMKVNTDIFNSLGMELLTDIPADSLVLMDELGFMETEALAFCGKVLEILDGPYFVLAVVKKKRTAFLESILSHQDAFIYEVTAENRDELYDQIFLSLKKADPLSPLVMGSNEQFNQLLYSQLT